VAETPLSWSTDGSAGGVDARPSTDLLPLATRPGRSFNPNRFGRGSHPHNDSLAAART